MFTKPTEYSIRALVYITLQNLNAKRPGFKEIAKEINSPEPYTAKILQNLTKHHVINSAKGRGGGFFFSKPNEILTLFDIIKITKGETIFSKCGFGLNQCDAENPCPLHDNYMPIREELFRFVKNENIQSMADKIIKQKAVLKRNISKIKQVNT